MGDNAIFDATLDTVVLGLDLLRIEAGKIETRLTAAIQDLNFQKEIENCLTEYGKLLLQKYSNAGAVTLTDAEKFAIKSLEDTGKKMGNEAWKDISDRIQRSDQYNQLRDKFEKLEKAVKEQPIGIWFTDSTAYIVASALILNGAAVVFLTSLAVKKVGTPAALTALEGKTLKFKPFGSLTIETGEISYNRTSKVADFKISGTEKWKAVKVELDVVAHTFVGGRVHVEGAAADARIYIPVAKNLDLGVSGGIDATRFEHKSILADLQLNAKVSTNDGTVSLGLSAFSKFGDGRRPEFGGGLGLELKFK